MSAARGTFARFPESATDEPGSDQGGEPAATAQGSDTNVEVASSLSDGVSFARLVWHDTRDWRPRSLTGFVSFDEFLLRFGAFAAHYQGSGQPDLTDLGTRAAFEVQVWMTG
jgi:hypothetical protein